MTNFVAYSRASRSPASFTAAASAQTKWDMPMPYPDGNFHTKNVAAVRRRRRQGDQRLAQDRRCIRPAR